MKIKNFWLKHKYTIIMGIMWFVLTTIIRYWNMTLLQHWIVLIFTLLFALIGYRDGKIEVVRNIIKYDNSIVIDVNECEFTYSKLKDIDTGVFFSLADDENEDKYMKCGYTDERLRQCWNLTKERFEQIDCHAECILYRTRIIYIPYTKTRKIKYE